jgi:hypothetical protein
MIVSLSKYCSLFYRDRDLPNGVLYVAIEAVKQGGRWTMDREGLEYFIGRSYIKRHLQFYQLVLKKLNFLRKSKLVLLGDSTSSIVFCFG